MNVEPVLEVAVECGESPVWAGEERALYFTDIPGKALHRFEPATGTHASWDMPEELCAFALAEGGGFIGAMRSGFARLNLERGTVDYLARPEADKPENRLNDGRCDRQGRFWAGSMHLPRTERAGTLYRLGPAGEAQAMAGDVIVSNGLAFSPDSQIMYWSDSRSSVVYAFDFDADTGDVANRRVFFETSETQGRPDGAAIDAEGFYWSACFLGGRILRIAPDGTLDREVLVPVRDVTMVAFGGDDLSTLFVTTSREALSPAEREETPLAGALFAFDPGVRGLPEPRFKGEEAK
ncbi:MAG: SMP-30/gluconolactonase/LRE family protein [Pseudomonadota bacterium]